MPLEMKDLSVGCLPQLLSGNYEAEEFTVQLLEKKKIDGPLFSGYLLKVSDGLNHCKYVIYHGNIDSPILSTIKGTVHA